MNSDYSSLSILGVKPGHDGSFALIENGRLLFSIEAEKDNHARYAELDSLTFLKTFEYIERLPDLLAFSGWSEGPYPNGLPIGAGYFGLEKGRDLSTRPKKNSSKFFTSSHERSHILCAYGMSPFEQGRPCYALVWEGYIGAFYFIDKYLNIKKLEEVLKFPGMRYAFLFGLADPTFTLGPGLVRLSDAGKLMAISGFASSDPVSEDGRYLVEQIIDSTIEIKSLNKDNFKDNRFYNCGVSLPDFAGVAKLLSSRIFEIFEKSAKILAKEKYPLLISGGCGLNCDWNSRWISSGIFDGVFIPPCTNDSGSAIGTAIDAQWHATGCAKITWTPYVGEYPTDDLRTVDGFSEEIYCPNNVAAFLADGKILGWLRGRYELGPRALGARSILASPTSKNMLDRLNSIKRRETFRPIAPICAEEDMKSYFSPSTPSPYMLEFRHVISSKIPAVTHIDGTSRPQSINAKQNPELHKLLKAFS